MRCNCLRLSLCPLLELRWRLSAGAWGVSTSPKIGTLMIELIKLSCGEGQPSGRSSVLRSVISSFTTARAAYEMGTKLQTLSTRLSRYSQIGQEGGTCLLK